MTYILHTLVLSTSIFLTGKVVAQHSQVNSTQPDNTLKIDKPAPTPTIIQLEDPDTHLILPWFFAPISDALTNAKPLQTIGQDILQGL